MHSRGYTLDVSYRYLWSPIACDSSKSFERDFDPCTSINIETRRAKNGLCLWRDGGECCASDVSGEESIVFLSHVGQQFCIGLQATHDGSPLSAMILIIPRWVRAWFPCTTENDTENRSGWCWNMIPRRLSQRTEVSTGRWIWELFLLHVILTSSMDVYKDPELDAHWLQWRAVCRSKSF